MMNRQQIGPYSCLKIDGSDEAPTIVLFHGYGADAADLASLSQMIRPHTDSHGDSQFAKPMNFNWVFPDGPEIIDLGLGFQGRAWFPLNIQGLEVALQQGRFESFIQERKQGLEKLHVQVQQFIGALNLPANRLYLGGFSQGAMLATHTALTMKEDIRGLIILSGTLVAPEEWRAGAERHRAVPFFQSHGQADPLLPVELATKLEKTLVDGGMKGHLQVFPGGHEIPLQVISAITSFLNECENRR